MRVEKLRRWHWMLISIGVGLMIGFVRGHLGLGGIPDNCKESFNGPEAFEPALFSQARVGTSKDGKPQMIPRIHPDTIIVRKAEYALQGKMVYGYAVICQWYNERSAAKPAADGKRQISYEHAWFGTETDYFHIRDDRQKAKRVLPKAATKLPPTSRADSLMKFAEKLKLKEPDPPGTVLDYLAKMQVERGIKFRYEWWHQPRIGLAAWTAGSFIVIGLIWPNIIYLIHYGSIFRPREKDDRSDLRNVKNKPTVVEHKPKITDEDLEAVRRMGDEIEAKLKDGAGVTAAAAPKPVESGPIKQLSAGPAATAPTPEKPAENKEFGATGEDFYPTEVHGRHK